MKSKKLEGYAYLNRLRRDVPQVKDFNFTTFPRSASNLKGQTKGITKI